MKYIRNNYKEFYYSTKQENKEFYFSLDFNIIYFEMDTAKNNKGKGSLDIEITIHYLFEFDRNTLEYLTLPTSQNKWLLGTVAVYNSCSLKDSIMIDSRYRSYGIGTLVLNKMLLIAKEYLPTYSLSGTLSDVDNYEENYTRRNKLYNHVGFNVSDSGFYIDKVSSLNLTSSFNYMYKVDYFEEIQKKHMEIHVSRKRTISQKNKIIDMYKDDISVQNKVIRKYRYYLLITILILLFCLYLKNK